MENRLSKPLPVLTAILAVAAVFAYRNFFLQDDAYIAFRYAAHFAAGDGLVWYPGSQEYGYTSFLFTFLTGLGLKTGMQAEIVAPLLSIPAYLASIALTFFIGRRISGSWAVPVISSLALATHLTFSAYATGGLETSLQTCLILAAYHRLICWRQLPPARWHLAAIGLYAALAMLTRLDSVILLCPLYGALALSLGKQRLLQAIWAVALPLLCVGGLLWACNAYYGHPLPNSFYVKMDHGWPIGNGLLYLFSYVQAQGYLPLYLIAFWLVLRRDADVIAPASYNRLLVAAPLVIWLTYLLYIGGDFMEFRFLVPVLPFFYLLMSDLIMGKCSRSSKPVAAILLLLILYANDSQRHYFTASHNVNAAGVESLETLDSMIRAREVNWPMAGKSLHRLFYTGRADDVKISVTAAGAIPYYSGLPVLDELGLNSLDVLHHAEPLPEQKPGHRLRATSDYIRGQRVNLMIGFPNFIHQSGNRYDCAPIPAVMYNAVKDTPIVFIPLENGYYLAAYYMNPHPAVDALIRSHTILRYAQLKNQVNCRKSFLPDVK